MIDGANQIRGGHGLGRAHVRYACVRPQTSRNLGTPTNPVDLVVAGVLVQLHGRSDSMSRILERVRQVLKPGGRFIFTVPHPLLPWIKPAQKRPFYMRPEGGILLLLWTLPFPGRIWRRDGASVEVQAVHKTFTTYFRALAAAGFRQPCRVVEELAHHRGGTWRSTPTSSGLWSTCHLHVAFSLSP